MGVVIFRTLKKHNVLIVGQNFMYDELYTQGAKKGKVKSKRKIQYVEDLDTIYVDEQRKLVDNPTATPVYIKKNILSVDENKVHLLDMLRKNPDNEKNGGHIFREVDVDKEELYEIEKFKAVDKVKLSILEKDENTLRAAAVFFLNQTYLKKTISTIRLKLRQAVEISNDNPTENTSFVAKLNAFFEEKSNNEKLTVTIALNENIVEIIGGKKVVWSDSKEPIFIAAQQNDVIKDFAVWLKTDEQGRQTLSSIAKKIDALK